MQASLLAARHEKSQAACSPAFLSAERKGFEPLERKAFNGFRDRPDRPLRHLSWSKNKATHVASSCGDRGIRTPEAFRLNGFQDRRYRPLSHISAAKIQLFAFIQLIRRKKNLYLCIFIAFQCVRYEIFGLCYLGYGTDPHPSLLLFEKAFRFQRAGDTASLSGAATSF